MSTLQIWFVLLLFLCFTIAWIQSRFFVAILFLVAALLVGNTITRADERSRLTVSVVVDTDVTDHAYAVAAVNRAAALIDTDLWMHVQIVSISYGQHISASVKAAALLDDVVGFRNADAGLAQSGATLFLTARVATQAGYNYNGSAYADVSGYSYAASAYTNQGAAFVTLDFGGLDYLVIAHELGHLLGAPHDDDGPCRGQSPAAGYIMQAYAIGPTTFSDCTIGQINGYVYSHTSDFYDALQHPASNVTASVPVPQTAQPVSGGGAVSWWLFVSLLVLALWQFYRAQIWKTEATRQSKRVDEYGKDLLRYRALHFEVSKEIERLRQVVSFNVEEAIREFVKKNSGVER